MYLISIYFDEKTSEKIKQYIKQVVKKTNNTYMLDANVPPHITISAFDTDNPDIDSLGIDSFGKATLDTVIEALEKTIPKISQGNITFASIGFFFPYVIFLQPVLNEYLHNLSVSIYDSISPLENVCIRKCYKPFQWLPHATIGKKLSKSEMLSAFTSMQDSFGLFEGTVTKISLSKTNPYTDIISWNLSKKLKL